MEVSIVKNFRLLLKSEKYDPRFPKSIGEIPGRMWHREKRVWTVPISSIDKLITKLVNDQIWSDSDAETVRELVKQLTDHTKVDISNVKRKVLLPLRSYQEDTLRFFKNRGSALGALDLALGKTFTSLAYYYDLLKSDKIEKCLMVVPVSAIFNWYREVHKFFDDELSVCIIGYEFDPISGEPRKVGKKERLEQLKSTKYDGFIMNYEKVKDIVGNPDVLACWSPPEHKFLTIADEVTRIKSWTAQRTKALKSLQSSYRIGLSGRPIENNIMEYFTILDWIWPKCLGSWGQFRDRFTVTDRWGGVKGMRDQDTIRQISNYIAIKYDKRDVMAELPPVVRNQYDIELSPEEEKDYEKISRAIEGAIEVLKGTRDQKGVMNVLSLFQMSRMFCDHPVLVRSSDSPTAKGLNIVCGKSSKLDEFRIIIDEILQRKGKAVVFSQFKKMCDILESDIQRNHPTVKVYKFSGELSTVKRQKVIDGFVDDQNPSVFVSTDSAAYAINLQAASYLINYDLPWNPAILDQRIGRLDRPGQKNQVCVINMVVKGPDKVEERVLEIISRKEKLYEDILGDESGSMDKNAFGSFKGGA